MGSEMCIRDRKQGRFASPVGAHKGDPIAPFDLQVGAQKQQPIVVAVAEILEGSHQSAGTGRRGELEPRPFDPFEGRFDALHFVQ